MFVKREFGARTYEIAGKPPFDLGGLEPALGFSQAQYNGPHGAKPHEAKLSLTKQG
jgi:hypothetical protein